MYKLYRISSISFLLLGFYLLTIGSSDLFFKNTSEKFSMNILFNNIQSHIKNNNLKSIDSVKINELYSEKGIESIEYIDSDLLKGINRIIVNIRPKPINPSIIQETVEVSSIKNSNSAIIDNFNFENISGSKGDFIKTLLPLISYQNQKILLEREKIFELRSNLLNNKTLTNDNLAYLNKIAKKYNIKISNKHKIDLVDEILISVDIIPNSIVLAQAANESAWGTSRFAKEYNAFFGEYTYDFSKGVIPLNREEGKKHLVKSFSSFDKSVESYFKNINSHRAYKKFRLIRKLMRDKNNFSNVSLLVETLNSYAEDDNYIGTINSIIESNNLYKFDIVSYTPSRS